MNKFKQTMQLIKQFAIEEPLVVLLISIYILAELSVITWGIPNIFHPFNYHMDEWHQMQAVRALFKHGTPNISGAAHGSIFQFFLSGIYLIPFIIMRIINPFMVHSPVANLDMQGKIFMVLRTNTLLFGVLSILTITIIAKRYVKTNPFLTAFLFTVTPLWIVLSNYFKYDIALTFWTILSILFLLNFGEKPTLKNYLLTAVPVALSFATKVAAIPLIIIYFISFFYFTPQFQKKYKWLIYGIAICGIICVFAGVPDILFRWNEWKEFITSNIVSNPNLYRNYILGAPNVLSYQLFVNYPKIFGLGFYVLFISSFFYWTIISIKRFVSKKNIYKKELFTYVSFLIFVASLVPLKLDATGNRLLVLLPFMTLLSVLFIKQISSRNKLLVYLYACILVIMIIQLYISSIFIVSKYYKSPEQASSSWILKNVPKNSIVGIENIPIYQSLPDIVLKEFYELQENNKTKTNFRYQIVDASTKNVPKYVVLSYVNLNEFLINSPTKNLITKLQKNNYKVVARFYPWGILPYFGNDLNIYLSGLIASAPVTVYER